MASPQQLGPSFQNPIFPTLILGSHDKSLIRRQHFIRRFQYDHARDFKAAWFEAEVFIFYSLSTGIHPTQLTRGIYAERSADRRPGYKYTFLQAAQRILNNMTVSGLFDYIPSFETTERFSYKEKVEFAIYTYEQFSGYASFREKYLDRETRHYINRSSKLDEAVEKRLRTMRERQRYASTEQYRENQTTLGLIRDYEWDMYMRERAADRLERRMNSGRSYYLDQNNPYSSPPPIYKLTDNPPPYSRNVSAPTYQRSQPVRSSLREEQPYRCHQSRAVDNQAFRENLRANCDRAHMGLSAEEERPAGRSSRHDSITLMGLSQQETRQEERSLRRDDITHMTPAQRQGRRAEQLPRRNAIAIMSPRQQSQFEIFSAGSLDSALQPRARQASENEDNSLERNRPGPEIGNRSVNWGGGRSTITSGHSMEVTPCEINLRVDRFERVSDEVCQEVSEQTELRRPRRNRGQQPNRHTRMLARELRTRSDPRNGLITVYTAGPQGNETERSTRNMTPNRDDDEDENEWIDITNVPALLHTQDTARRGNILPEFERDWNSRDAGQECLFSPE